MSNYLDQLRLHAKRLKNEIVTLYLVARDPRTPWYAKAVIAGVVAYALSPIDLIPDFIPVLGYLDDLLLLPLGIYLAIKLIPASVLADARQKASLVREPLAKNLSAAVIIIILWLATAIILGIYLFRHFGSDTQSLIGARPRINPSNAFSLSEKHCPLAGKSTKICREFSGDGTLKKPAEPGVPILPAVAFPDARQPFRAHRN